MPRCEFCGSPSISLDFLAPNGMRYPLPCSTCVRRMASAYARAFGEDCMQRHVARLALRIAYDSDTHEDNVS